MTNVDAASYPYGVDIYTRTEVIPKTAPAPPVKIRAYWTIGPVSNKDPAWNPADPTPSMPHPQSEVKVQLTADQQVSLSISGEDAYGNPVDITGTIAWISSNTAIIQVTQDGADNQKAVASAVGPVGTAAVTVTNDVNLDGTGDFMGSIAIDVVAGAMTEIVVEAGTPEAKP